MIKGIDYTTNNDGTATVSIQFETRNYAKEFLEEVYHIMNQNLKDSYKIGGTD